MSAEPSPASAEPLERYTAHMRAGGIRPGTIRIRLWHLRVLSAATPDPWAVGLDDLAEYIGRNDRWGPEARKSARGALRGFYRWAHVSGRLTADPSAFLPPVRVPAGVPRPTPEPVLLAVLDRATDRERLMVMLAGYAGLRCAEIAQVRFDDVRGDELLVHGKGGRIRVVPLHPSLVDVIERERALRSAGTTGTGWRFLEGRARRRTTEERQADAEVYMFPGQSTGPVTAGNVSTTLSKLLGPGLTGHTLRHRFASQAYAGTRLLGHSKPETTARYTAVPDGALAPAMMAAGPGAR